MIPGLFTAPLKEIIERKGHSDKRKLIADSSWRNAVGSEPEGVRGPKTIKKT